MKKIAVLTLIFLLILIPNVSPKDVKCKDKCVDSTLYTNGKYDNINKICIYDTTICEYGCSIDKPECNALPEDTHKSLEKIYKKLGYIEKNRYFRLFGTEYQIGEHGTIFLQLKDNQGNPIKDGSCYLDIYYPNYDNITHEPMITNAPMLFLDGSDGLYYYEVTIPKIIGVYMMSAICSYKYSGIWVFQENSLRKSNITIVKGEFNGDTYSLNSQRDGLYMTCYASGGKTKICDSYYDFDTNGFGVSINDSVNLFYSGKTTTSGVITKIYVYNWNNNSFIELPNTLTHSGITDVDDFVSNSFTLSQDYIKNDTIRIRKYSYYGSSFTLYDNWISMNIIKQNGTITDIKGAGELHVSDIQKNIEDFILGMQEVTDPIETYCENDTLVTKRTRVYNINNRNINITEEERQECIYGCAENRCVLYPYESILIILVIVMALFVIYYLIFRSHFI